MLEKKKKKSNLLDPVFLKEFWDKYPHLKDENWNLTISVWTKYLDGTEKSKYLTSNAMPDIVFNESSLGAIKSLKVTLWSYEDSSEQLLHFFHKKTEV